MQVPPTLPLPVKGMRFIYALTDPRTSEVRYIGCTANLRRRLRTHCTVFGDNMEKDAWVRELALAGERPLISVLEIASSSSAFKVEGIWISRMFTDGAPLFNFQRPQPKNYTHLKRKQDMAVIGRLGGLTTAATRDVREMTRAARERSLSLDIWLERVPDSVPEEQRVAAAERLRQRHYVELGRKSGLARRRKAGR